MGTAAIVGLSLALSSLLSSATKGGKAALGKNDFIALSQNIRAALKDPNFCASALKNGEVIPSTAYFNPDASPTSNRVLSSISIGTQVLAHVGQVQSNFTVTQLQLSEVYERERAERWDGAVVSLGLALAPVERLSDDVGL